MSIRLIYGKSGAGKSEFIFNEIKELINCGKKIYIKARYFIINFWVI